MQIKTCCILGDRSQYQLWKDNEKNESCLKYNELANSAGITPSTVYSLMDSNRRDVSIITIKKLCDGLDIKISDFFNSLIFDNLEQETK